MYAKQSNSIDIDRVAHLAHLPITEDEKKIYLPQLSAILSYVAKLNEVATEGVEPTSQVTGLVNVFREDAIDTSRMLTQKEALANAPATYKGFIKVKAVFGE